MQRIRYGWGWQRIFFLLIGSLYLYTSIMDGMWFGIVVSFFFIFQALLGIGCAGGNCPIEEN